MGKLDAVLQQLNAQRMAPQLARDREVTSGINAAGQLALVSIIENSVAKYVKALQAVVESSSSKSDGMTMSCMETITKEIEEAEEDLEEEITNAFQSLLVQISSMEERVIGTIKAIPAPPKPIQPKPVDLSAVINKIDFAPVLDDLQWIKTFLALDKAEDDKEEEKKQWTFTVERDRQGFIKEITAA